MLLNIAIILLVLWFFGFIIFPVAGALIHVLLVFAVVVILLRVIKGEKILR
ncbi:MAG: lmo0937 family membrane protein [Candidatus Pacebacteria bacterium]|nr:lmo0937 family membrane protein [Candidatus Paceibacterota bacterium]